MAAYQIRNGNTDDYRQFWNEGPRRQLGTPKHEDACRDALLSDMQQRLVPLGIDAQPEDHNADDKRADIRVSYGGKDRFEVHKDDVGRRFMETVLPFQGLVTAPVATEPAKPVVFSNPVLSL